MSMSIFEYGDGRFRLFHGDREVGWVEARAVGFADWETEAAAIRAATVAYDALSAWLARQRRQDAVPRGHRALRAREEGGERVLTLGGIAVGRLVHEPLGDGAGGGHGFELVLPPRIGSTLTAAQVIDQALLRHRELRELEHAGAPESTDLVV